MSVIEFHPEDLLDRELEGTLSDADRLRLAAHLERCAACRLERQLRLDFEQELGPRKAAPDLHPVVSDVLRAAGVKPSKVSPQAGSAAPSVRRWLVAGLVACALFGTGMAAAQLGLADAVLQLLRGDEAPAHGAQARARPVKHAEPAAAALPEATVENTETLRAEAAVERVEPSPTPANSGGMSTRARTHRVSPRAQATPQRAGRVEASHTPGHALEAYSTENAQSAPAAQARPSDSGEASLRKAADSVAPSRASERNAPPVTAATLFELASRARRSGAMEEARALYRELQTRFPQSPEARLSLALLARLQLDRGELSAALEGFETYLATAHRALREEAMVGRARTLERLGRARDAKRAWRDLLEAYPESAAAEAARRRVGQNTP